MKALQKICLHNYFSSDTLNYFLVEENYQRERFLVIQMLLVFTLIYHMGRVQPLSSLLETSDNKQISNDTSAELAKIVLTSNIFEFDEKTVKQKHEIAIRMKFAHPYAIFLWLVLRKKCWKLLQRNQLFGGDI